MNKETKIIFSIATVIIIGVVSLLAFGPKGQISTSLVDTSLLVRENSHMTGKVGAKVTIVEFADYQCPACRSVYPTLKQVVEAYKGNPDFNFVTRNFPLSQHKNAIIAAEAAESAGTQGKFWDMEKLLYENQSEWSGSENPMDLFIKYADKIGLDRTKFREEIESGKHRSFIEADRLDGVALNVSWTPSIYINGELQQSTPSLEQFKSKIDELLKK